MPPTSTSRATMCALITAAVATLGAPAADAALFPVGRVARAAMATALPPAAPRAAIPPRADPAPSLPAPPSAAELDSLRRALDASTSIDDASRAGAVASVERARAKVDQIVVWDDRAARFEQGRLSAAAELGPVKAEVDSLKDPVAVAVASVTAAMEASAATPEADSPKALRQRRAEADAAVVLAKEKLAEIERDVQQRGERRAALPAEIGRVAGELDELDDPVSGPEVPAAERNATLAAVERAERSARAGELRSKVAALRAEQASLDDRVELDGLLRERAAKRVGLREAEAQEWQRRIDAAVARDAAREAQGARREAAEGVAAVRTVSQKTLELVEQRTGEEGLIARNADVRQRLERLATRLPVLAAEYDRERLRAASTGTSGLTSARLRLQRAQLPDARYLADVLSRAREDLFTTQRRQADLEAEIAALPKPAEERDQLLAAMEADSGVLAPELRTEVAAELDRRIAEQRRQYDLLLAAYREREALLLRAMDGVPGATALAAQFSSFIDERILWIRSVEPLGPKDFGRAWATLRGLAVSARDVVASGELRRTLEIERLPLSLMAILIVAWIATIGRRRRAFAALAERTARYSTDGMGPTVAATGLTVLEAFFWPCVLLLACSRVGTTSEASAHLQALVAGVRRTTLGLFVILPLLALVRTNGLAQAHFGWRDQTRRQLRHGLRWLAILVVPLSFIVGATEWTSRGAGSDLLGRMAFVASMLVVAGTFGVLLRPRHGVLAGVVATSRSRWTPRMEPLWRLLAVATPLSLAVLAALGWYYTAHQLDMRLVASMALVILLVFAHAFVTRWLLLSRRRLATAELRKRREAMRAAEEPGQAASAEGGSVPVEESAPNISSIDAQTRQLLGTAVTFALLLGLWGIWAQVLPALSGLNRFELWPNFGRVRESATLPPPSSVILAAHRFGAFTVPTPIGAPSAPVLSVPPVTGSGTAAAASNGGSAASAPQSSAATDEQAGRAAGQPDGTLPMLTGSGIAAQSDTASAAEDAGGALTVGNVINALIMLIATILVARNIPGLLEVSLLQRLPVENSVRYAITTLTSYAVWGIGIALTFAAVGIGWSKVQWLVAAVSVGIGFGLQEIVANLISGIIILFEQPIRVGDTVTVNGVSGTVSRIRIRATTITDWDRKELIIPNKTFITGQVINWTLSDAALRVVVPVGVDYGVDPRIVVKLLREIAAANPLIMKDPPPSAVFVAFGESALNFELRVVVPSIEHLASVRHDLHMAIDERFKADKLNIAFPQRDVHVSGALELAPRSARRGEGVRD